MFERKCTACGHVKPYDAFYRSPNKDLKKIQRCLSCEKDRWHKVKSKAVFIGPRQQTVREKELYEKELRELTLQVKTCSRCNEEKSFSEFGSCKGRPYSLHIFCSECIRSERLSKYKTDENYRVKVRERIKAWRHANKDKVFEQGVRYRKSNPNYWRNAEINRRAFIKNSGEHRTDDEWNELLKYVDMRCVQCFKKCVKPNLNLPRTEWITEDHIIPLSRGGTDVISNIQPLCFSCNSGKNNYNSINYMIDFRERLEAFMSRPHRV